MTQSQLALLIDKEKTVVSLYENGKREPPLNTASKLAEVLGVSIDDFINTDLSISSGQPTGTKAVMKRTAKQYAEAIEYDEMTAEEVAREIGNENMKLVNRLLMQRVLELEQAIKDADPEMAKRLKIE